MFVTHCPNGASAAVPATVPQVQVAIPPAATSGESDKHVAPTCEDDPLSKRSKSDNPVADDDSM
eukprot:4724345-Prymnesium_polylepis.1